MKKIVSMIAILTLCSGTTVTHKNAGADEIVSTNTVVEFPYEIKLTDVKDFALKIHKNDALSIFSETNIRLIGGEEYYFIPSSFLNFRFDEKEYDFCYISKKKVHEPEGKILYNDYTVPGEYEAYISFTDSINDIMNTTIAETVKIHVSEETLVEVAVEESTLVYSSRERITYDRVIQEAGIEIFGLLTEKEYDTPIINLNEITGSNDYVEEGLYRIEVPSKEWREAFIDLNPFVHNIKSKFIQMLVQPSNDDLPLNNNDEIVIGDYEKDQETLDDNSAQVIRTESAVQINYRTHIQNFGWQQECSNGEISGRVGEGLRLEAFELNVLGELDLSITYAVKVMDESWSPLLSEGSTAGTVGQAKALEAMTAQLEGTNAADYHVYYRVFNEKYGWMGWAKNGEKSGTEGLGYQIEAIQFMVTPSNEPFEESTEKPFIKPEDLISFKYRIYTDGEGWSGAFSPDSDDQSSPKGEKPMEDLEIIIDNPFGLGIAYSVLKNGQWIYSTESRIAHGGQEDGPIQGVRMELTGDKRNIFELYYRVYKAGTGWMGWANDGFPSGSDGFDEGILDIQMVVGLKGSLDFSKENAFISNNGVDIQYELYSSELGWLSKVSGGKPSVANLKEKLLALKFRLGTGLPMGSVRYQVHVQNVGWMDIVENGEVAGKPSYGYHVEAVRIFLEGTISEFYDIYYRVKGTGFESHLGWTKNGDSAGSEGFGLGLQDIEVKLVKKEDSVDDSSTSFFEKGNNPIVIYRSSIEENRMSGYQFEDRYSGSVGQALGLREFDIASLNLDPSAIKFSALYDSSGWVQGTSGVGVKPAHNDVIRAIKVSLAEKYIPNYDIFYRVHIQNHGWLGWTRNGMAAGSIGEHLRLEAFEVKIVPKGLFSYDHELPYLIGSALNVTADTHIQNIGWRYEEPSTQQFGTTGRSLRLEALSLNLSPHLPEGNIVLGAFVQGEGWRSSADQAHGYVGSEGQSKRIEELTLSLSGNVQYEFDIYYRVHVARVGWLGWAKNGERAGSALYQNGIEAFEVRLVPRQEEFDSPIGTPFIINIPNNLKTKFMDKNDCYIINQKIQPQGIVLHSTATPGVMAGEWFDRWNKSYEKGETNRQVAVHSFVDEKEIWQYLPWDHRGWHAGGTANNTHIGIEMCEPVGVKYSGGRIVGYNPAAYSTYFSSVWNNAVTLSAILARFYNFTEADIISHNEGYYLGVASNHSDVGHWFPLHGKNMDMFRAEVRSRLYQ